MFVITDNIYDYSSHTQEDDAILQLERFNDSTFVIKEVDDSYALASKPQLEF